MNRFFFLCTKRNCMATPYQDNEIDLLELLAKFIFIIRRNTKMILLAFIVGTLLGLAYYQFVPKTYESQMVVTSDILTASYSKTLFENIDQLVKERNITGLSSKLNIAPELATMISEIEIKSTIEKADGLKEQDKSYLTIKAQSSDNTIWPSLQNGIIHYLQNNDFVKVRVDQKRRYFTEIIKKIDEELKDLQALKSLITSGELVKRGKENLVLFDPTSVNTKIVELNKEKFNLQNSLEIVNSVQVVDGFTVYEKPSSPKLSVSLAAGASFGLFFVAVVIAFKGIRSMLRFSEEKLGQA